jgi:hypothetical protein
MKKSMTSNARFVWLSYVAIVASAAIGIVGSNARPIEEASVAAATKVASKLPDLSGLVWLDGDRFLAVHDAKNPGEVDRRRVSLVSLPTSLDGVTWRPLTVRWPQPLGPSSDLESAARIPDTDDVLVVESGDDGSEFHRIIRTRVSGPRLEVLEFADWPAEIENVEGTAVARVGAQLVFVYAERAQGDQNTAIRWASLEIDPLEFGSFQEAVFASPDPTGPDARPVTALEVDGAGRLYASAATDADDDNGPFRSVVYEIGQFELVDGEARLSLYEAPRRIATLDGLKVEAVAVRPDSGGGVQVFVGFDDENYGGTVRRLPPR